MKQIYLDNASTTKVYKKVIKEILPYFEKEYGNPSSPHKLGEKSKKAMNQARISIAKEVNALPREIIFTSGATESNNLAIQGLAKNYPDIEIPSNLVTLQSGISNRHSRTKSDTINGNVYKRTIITSNIEHPSINEVCNYMQTINYKIIKIPVNKEGIINLDILEKEIKNNLNDILLVSIMYVNNILGVIQDIEKIGLICKLYNIPFHTDAVQAFGKIKIDVKKYNIGLLSASGHKIGGPKGIGILYINEKINISPILYGGGQEQNLRSGTENVPGIMGMAKALEITKKINKNKIKEIRDKLMTNLEKVGAIINGSKENRLYNNVHASFRDIEAESLIQCLSKKRVYISTGSACDSKKEKEDHVLKAIKLNENLIMGSIRISLNEDISEKDISFATKEIEKALKLLRIK